MPTPFWSDLRARPWHHLGLLLVGGVFLFSAGAKLANLYAFQGTLLQQGVTNSYVVAVVLARVLVTAEFLLGVGVPLPYWRRRVALPLVAVTLLAFTLYLIPRWLAKDTGNCGCFGEVLSLTAGESIVKNLVLLPLTLWLWRRATPDRHRAWLWLNGAVVVALGLVFLIWPPHLAPVAVADPGSANPQAPLPPSKFAIFRDFKPQPADLTKGICVVAFFSTTCEHCQGVAEALTEIQPRLNGVPIYLVMLGEENEVPKFLAIAGADYPYVVPPMTDFFKFVEAAPPCLYLLRDGQVLVRWDQPAPELVRETLPTRLGQARNGVAISPLPAVSPHTH